MELTFDEEMVGISPLVTGPNIEFRNARASKIRERRAMGGRKFIIMQQFGFRRIGKLWKNPNGKVIPVDVYKRLTVDALNSRIAQLVG